MWLISASKQSGFRFNEGILFCNDINGWSILSQKIPNNRRKEYLEKQLTFSVKMESEKETKVYMTIGYMTDKEYRPIVTDVKTIVGKSETKFISAEIPKPFHEEAVLVCRIYLNQEHSCIRLINAYLEFGSIPNQLDWF